MGIGVRGVMLIFAVPAISLFLSEGNVSIDLERASKQAKTAIETRNRILHFFIIKLKIKAGMNKIVS